METVKCKLVINVQENSVILISSLSHEEGMLLNVKGNEVQTLSRYKTFEPEILLSEDHWSLPKLIEFVASSDKGSGPVKKAFSTKLQRHHHQSKLRSSRQKINSL